MTQLSMDIAHCMTNIQGGGKAKMHFYDLNITHTNCVGHTKYVYRKINSIQLICYIEEYCELWIPEMGTYDHISLTISLSE